MADDCAEIVRNKPRIVPLTLVKYGERNGKIIYGINFTMQTIWEYMNGEDFIKINLLEKLDEMSKRLEKLENQR